jgi:four helix bundle suffix protein
MQHHTPRENSLIPKHGGYRNLKSFQLAQLVYDLTVRFCDRYIDKRSRTHDQMVQAARSGVQNIAEGSQASGTSKKFEIKLTNVARASLEELRLDYQDFLRHRDLPEWAREDSRRFDLVARRCTSSEEVAGWIQEVVNKGDEVVDGRGGLYGRDGQYGQGNPLPSIKSTSSIKSIKPTTPSPCHPEVAANAALVLIGVATSLLDRQVAAQARAFETQGGFTERLYNTRRNRYH